MTENRIPPTGYVNFYGKKGSMAKVLKKYDFNKVQKRTRSGSKYDWENWLDGRIWELKRGDDFHVITQSFRAMCYAKSTELKCKIRVSSPDGIEGDTIVIQKLDLV